MAVQTKGQQKSTKPKKSGNVQDISSFKKKPIPFNDQFVDPIGRCILSSAVKVELCGVLDRMWTPNHPKVGQVPANDAAPIKVEVKVPTVSSIKDSPPWKEDKVEVHKTNQVHINDGRLMQDVNPDLKRWFMLKDNPNCLCQDLHNGLRMWLEAYCPIPNNVCVLSDKDKHIARTEASRKKRKRLGRPEYEDNHYVYIRVKKFSKTLGHSYWSVEKRYKTTWDTRTKNQNILHPIKGWHGYRSPTLVELLVQAYKQGYNFRQEAIKRKKKSSYVAGFFETLKAKIKDTHYDDFFLSQQEEASNDGHQIIADHWPMSAKTADDLTLSWAMAVPSTEEERYQQKLWKMALVPFKDTTPLHLTNIVKAKKVMQLTESRRYWNWLYSREPFNPHIDYVPMCHRHVDSLNGVSFLYGDRYEGRKAAEFAPASRGNKDTSWFLDCKWNRFLCYYHGFKKGHISGDQLTEIGKFIYGDIKYCSALLSNVAWNTVQNEQKPMLMLPAPAKAAKMPEPCKLSETVAVASILESHHPSGLEPDAISHLLIRKAWKNIGSILVPEDYNPEVNKCIITDIHSWQHKKGRQARSA